MTLRTKPIMIVSVTKKPDGRLVLNYTRTETTAVPASSQPRGDEGSTATSIEGLTTPADAVRATEDGAQGAPQIK
jgi:hypothetical protein